jgi:hypothetical protein
MLDLPLLVPYGLSLLACLAMLALWAGEQVTWILGLVLGLLVAVGSAVVLPLLLLLLQGYLLDSEISSGRISPTLSYRIIPSSRLVLSTYNWDPQKHPEYILFRNPQWVRWIHRVEARGPMPCVPEHPGLANWIVRAEPDGHTVSISCALDPLQRESTPTAEISVP